MGKHNKSQTEQERQAQAKADAFDAQWTYSQETYVEPTLQEKADAYVEARRADAEARRNGK